MDRKSVGTWPLIGDMFHTLYHAIAWTWGGDGQGGPNSDGYLIMSGPAAALGVFGALVTWTVRSRCEEHHCWRHGRHKDREGKNVCRKHLELGLPTDAFHAIQKMRESHEEERRVEH